MDFNEIITNLLLTVATGVIGAVGTWVTMYLKSKLNSNQLGLLEDIAANVVLAVEQSTYGSELADAANEKKAAAMTALSELLKKYSINLSPEQMDVAIEAAVANVLNANKLVEQPKITEVEGPTDFIPR